MSNKLWPLAVITFVIIGYYNASTEYTSFNFKLLPAFVIYWITYWSLGFYYLYMDSLPRGDYYDQYQNTAVRGPRLTADDYKSGLNIVYKELWIAMALAFSAAFMLDQIPAPFPLFTTQNNYLSTIFTYTSAFIVILICIELWQYSVHRILHIPQFFKLFHSQHHKHTKPYALAGLSGHWIEYIILPFPAICLGPFLIDLPIIPLTIIFALLAIGNISGHSGHNWIAPSTYDCSFHDLHHINYSVNYGALRLMDKIFGTYMIAPIKQNK